MSGQRPQEQEEPASSLGAAVVGASLGALAALFVVPRLLPPLQTVGAEDFWHLSRMTGWEAYFFLWASTMLGIAMSGRLTQSWLGNAAASLHEFTGLLGMALALAHALLLLGDRFIGFSPQAIFLPFVGQRYRPLPVALGQVALYVAAVASLTFYARRWLGARAWRRLHYGTYVAFVLGAAHAFWTGSDAATAPALWFLGLTALAVYSFTIYRIWGTYKAGRAVSPHAS